MNSNTKVWSSLGALVLATVAGVFAVEKGFSNDPNDSGGATNHGVTEAVAREHGYTGAMQALPQGMAQDIYIKTYIKRPKFDQVLAISPAVGTKVIDGGVNAGPGRSACWLQTSLNALSRGGRDYPEITVDGAVGKQTIAAYRALERRRGRVKACEMVVKLMDAQQATHYMTIGRNHANASFMVGWVDHRIGNVPLSRCAESVLGVTP